MVGREHQIRARGRDTIRLNKIKQEREDKKRNKGRKAEEDEKRERWWVAYNNCKKPECSRSKNQLLVST